MTKIRKKREFDYTPSCGMFPRAAPYVACLVNMARTHQYEYKKRWCNQISEKNKINDYHTIKINIIDCQLSTIIIFLKFSATPC